LRAAEDRRVIGDEALNNRLRKIDAVQDALKAALKQAAVLEARMDARLKKIRA
jgi:hypothetical protein